ncbi:TPR-like protein [Imleria badia]|nr:TPR-like protein [Imleria badia]
MHLLLGNSRLESGDYTGAIRSFERARAQMRPHTSQALSVFSLISGWKFDDLAITIQRQLCEALCAAGRRKEAAELVLKMVKTFRQEVYMSETLTKWISDFTRRCLSTLVGGSDKASKAAPNDKLPTLHPTSSPLLQEWARASLMCSPWKDALIAASGVNIFPCTDTSPVPNSVGLEFTAPRPMIYRAICERLETMDHILDASECFLQMKNELTGKFGKQAIWAEAFRKRCTEKLERLGDVAADAQQHDDAITRYSAALSLKPPIPHVFIKRSKVYIAKGLWEDALEDVNQVATLDPSTPWGHERVLMEWAKVNLKNGLWKDALSAAHGFKIPRVLIYRTLCQGLEAVEGMIDAIDCFHQMTNELTEETIAQAEQAEWVLEFRYSCSEKLERFGDAAMDSQQHDEALKYYSAALSVHPTNNHGFSILQSKHCMAKGLWEDALNVANEAIAFDPLSPRGYETKRAALHGAGRYDDAIQTFETVLSMMGQSPDPQVRERSGQYIRPSSTRTMIRKIVQRTIRHFPRVLINMTTGRLQNKTEQAAAFMSLPIVNKLVSSMTTHIDRRHIKREVRHFFRYVMLSHKWEENEPLFQQVIHMAVYDLQQSPTHDKLQMFCKIVRDAGFDWAWSDTCCIDKQDHFVLQEALVAMFKWYRSSALVIVFLRGVSSLAQLGGLMKSIWNTRAWTLQEYVAGRVVQFYTEDWTPYLNLDTFNHKESPEIISEMETATGVSAQQLTSLRPGLSSIRDKLRLASTRQTTMIEDVAYSLLGIFSVSGIPAIYGEGENALGRLLAHILTGSGDVSVLAWTGQSGGFNSCLPAHITVFNRPASSHVPPPVEDSEMEKIITTLRTSALDLDLALKLYDRLNDLPSPWFVASRMKLPCIAFKLPALSPSRTSSGRVYRVETPAFGMLEIKTKQDPTRLNSLYLIYPWLDVLLDREDMYTGEFMEDDVEEPSSPGADDEDVSDEEAEDDFASLHEHEPPSPPARTDTVPMDRETRALRLLARLRQPFGALLLTLTSMRRRSVVYRRVAADSAITVQLRESVPLSDVLENVRILDVL